MKKYSCYIFWLVLSCVLYFFENNAGTRIVLCGSLLLPLLPSVRRALFGQDEAAARNAERTRTVTAFEAHEADEPGDVRAWQPGDPIGRIHWKLSAKRDELLVRDTARDMEKAEEEKTTPSADRAAASSKRRAYLIGILVFLLSLALLFVLPPARQGMKTLMNRLYDASEAVNAYVYDRFDVPPGVSAAPAAVLLAAAALSLAGMALLSARRWPLVCLMAGIVLFQVYFGLAFPFWTNTVLFALFVLRMMKRPRRGKSVLSALAVILAVSLGVLLIWPGTDAATEAASERVRDILGQMAQSVSGAGRELPPGENETRHTYPLTLEEGSREAFPEKEYRLVTVEEEQISKPHWIDTLRIILLLLATAAIPVLPFLPIALMNRRRKKALDARRAFLSENVSEAVFAIFQHITAWLEATGNGGGNAPYAHWRVELTPDYARRFAECEKLFEEAAYSTHEMREEQREQALELLKETEETLMRKAGWKTRLRLRYRECLWV